MLRSDFRQLSACAALAVLVGCSSGMQAPLDTPNAQEQRNVGPGTAVGIEFDNKATTTIHPDGYTPIGCPWAVTQPPYPVLPGSSQDTVLVYNANCVPNEPLTWSVAYGTNLSRKATICTWTVTHTAAAGFSYAVANRARTRCTFGYSGNLEHFYYDSRE